MPTDVQIRFRAQGAEARREIEQLQNEVKELRGQLGQTGRAADAAETEVQQLGQQSRQAAGGVDKLGDEARETAQEVTLLGNRFRQTGRSTIEFGGTTGIATRGVGAFTGSLGLLRNTLGALGIVAVTQELGRFGVESVQAAGRMEQYVRATTQIEGSSEAAAARIESLIEVANLPGLNFEALTRYSNRLRAAGFAADDTDKILLTVGQTIVSLGGSAEKAALSMEQIIQAIQLGNIDMRDFRTIIQQVPSLLETLGDVHGVEANIDGLREAFNKTGRSMRDLLIPVFDELARRFEGPPADSYIVAMDTLENAFFLLQATIGDQFLPAIVRGAQGLTEFFEAIRAGIQDTSTLPEPIQEIIAGGQALFDALQRLGDAFGNILGPPVRELAGSLGGLLAEVLELGGALLNLLNPLLQATAYVAGTVVAAITQLTEHIAGLVGGLADGIEFITFWENAQGDAAAATDRLTKSVESATAALEEHATAGDRQRARLQALRAELEQTNADIARYEAELRKAGEAGVSNRSTEQFQRLLQTARERVPGLTAEIEKLTAAYGGLTAELGSDATAVERQEAKLKDLQTELAAANAEVERYEQSLANARKETLGETNSAIEHYARRLAGAKAEQARVTAEIGKAGTQLTVLKNATAEATGATDKNTDSVKSAKVEYVTYGQFVKDATREIKAFSELSDRLQGFDDFWRVAAGEVGEYTTAIDLANVSVSDHAAELEALHNAGFFDGFDAPIADYVAGLEATSHAADSALGPLNRVGQSVRTADADFRNAEERLRDFDDAFKRSEATIPRLTSEMQNFAGQVPQGTEEVREFQRELEDLNRTGQDIDLSSVADALDIDADPLQRAVGEMDRLSDRTEIFEDIAVRAFDELSRSVLQSADSIDTVGEALASVSDIAARIAFGDLTAIAELPFRITDINAQQDALAQQRRQERRSVAIDERTLTGTRDENLASLARVLGIPVGRFDISEAPHTVQGLRSLNDFSGTGLDILSRNLLTGRTDIAGGIEAGIEQAVDNSNLGEAITRSLTTLAVNLEQAITGADIDAIYTPFLGSLETAMTRAGANFEDAIDRDAPTGIVTDSFNDYLSSINAFFDLQIENVRAQERATGAFLTATIQSIEDARADVLNQARLLDTRTNITPLTIAQGTTAARSLAERTGTDRQFTEDIARAQYGEAVYEAEVAATQVIEGVAAVAEEAAEILRNVHRFTSEENDLLGGLRNAVEIAQEAVNRLDADSTTQEIAQAYQELTTAEQAYFNAQTGFIKTATGITETARTQALAQARIGFENRIASANAALVAAFAGIGQELTTTLTEWRAILQGSALAVQAIPVPDEVTVAPVAPPAPPRDTSLLRNRVDRAQFDLGFSDSEADFERRRGVLLNAINAFYDAELERIAQVADAETELQDLREDNQLARDRALQRATTATNTFAEQRIRSEAAVAAAAERAAQEQERATQRAQQAAAQAAARQAEQRRREQERARQAAAREAERSRQAQARAAEAAAQAAERQRRQEIGEASALDRNRVEQAQFALSTAGSEAEFEERRQALIQATDTYYDNELARIEALGGSEAALQDRREDNQLARLRALQRIRDTDNRFATERIRNEQRVADAAARAAEKARQEQERAAEQARQEAARQQEIAEREAERQAQEAERQRRRAIAGASALDRNRVDRARFALGLSGSEQEFERNRRALIRATNAYYANELDRIEALGGSEQELQDQREDNALAYERALQQASTADNRFATERIRNEERAQQELERQRAQALAEAARRESELQDLRDAALEAERQRQEDLVALEAETQERITDIHKDANQDREDIAREFSRDVQDTFREAQSEIAELLSAEGFSGDEIRAFLSGFEGDVRSQLSESGRSQLDEIQNQRLDTEIGLRRERDRDLEDVGIEETRRIEETRLQQERERIAIEAQLSAQQSELTASMAALTEEISGISATETVVAAASEATTAAEQAASHAMEAVESIGTGIESANTAASTLDEIVSEIGSVAEPFVQAANLLSQIDALPRFVDAVEALPERMAVSFHHVLDTYLVSPLISAFDGIKTDDSVPERTGILPIGVPVGQESPQLFHYESTDAIANRIARQAALSRPRAAPSYFPTQDQMRNARDVSREIVAGLTEGLSQRERSSFEGASQSAGFPEELAATVVLQFNDGSIQEFADQILRLREQERTNL